MTPPALASYLPLDVVVLSAAKDRQGASVDGVYMGRRRVLSCDSRLQTNGIPPLPFPSWNVLPKRGGGGLEGFLKQDWRVLERTAAIHARSSLVSSVCFLPLGLFFRGKMSCLGGGK